MSIRKIAVGDFETNKFLYNREIKPFAAEFYDGETKRQFWGPDAVAEFVAYCNTLEEEYIIYFHNGGRFDFYLGMLPHFDGNIKIINRRIVKASIGIQEFRDSFSIMPEPLKSFPGQYGKKEIDYDLFEEGIRENHKAEICEYMHYDCLTLYENVVSFVEEFGTQLTIGGAAMKELRKRHTFQTCNQLASPERWDAEYRRFYYGGRSQCFKTGVIHGNYQIYDVNGMYQAVMRDDLHPAHTSFRIGKEINERTDFAVIKGRNGGCLPYRHQHGVSFTVERGEFFATIHEIKAGLDTGTLEIDDVVKTYECIEKTKFDKFIDHFYAARLRCKAIGDLMHDSNYKRVMNSSYGKFATNAANFMDYCVTHDELLMPPWKECTRVGLWAIWERPARRKQWFNVAIAASITGSARARLLRGLQAANDPVYCDTDSIICNGFKPGADVELDAKKLGAWKQESKIDPVTGKVISNATMVAMAGKKLYAVFEEEFCIKQASKGARLTPQEIREIAEGKIVRFDNPVPHFKYDNSQKFIHRRVRATAEAGYIGTPKG